MQRLFFDIHGKDRKGKQGRAPAEQRQHMVPTQAAAPFPQSRPSARRQSRPVICSPRPVLREASSPKACCENSTPVH